MTPLSQVQEQHVELELVTAETDAARQTRVFPSSSGHMFGSYFTPGRQWSFKKTGLLDTRARRIFETTAMGCAADAYPFHMPLEAKAGPCVQADGQPMLMMSSYDYLGLIGHPRIDAAAQDAIRRYGTSTSGARLLTGTLDIHNQVERDLAEFKGTEASLTFSSGYMANLGLIYGLFGPSDRIIIDALCHRSLLDACKMAGVQVQRFRHNDPESLRDELKKGPAANRTVIISDGVFSMDGDICCLPELIAIKKEFGAFLFIDEAHASGVLGATGRGTDEHFGIATEEVDLWSGSLAKSIPSVGGFVACSQEVAIFLQHASSPYIFSAAMAASATAAISEGLAILREEPQRVARLKANGDFLRSGLQALGYDTGLSETAIIPVVLNDEITTGLFARKLRDYGIIAAPVMFPAVAQGVARLRLCVTAAHTREQLDFVLETFRDAGRVGAVSELVTILRYRDLSEAIVARSLIESSGITSYLYDENMVRLDWQISNFIGGIRLQVEAFDALEASGLLDQGVPATIDFGGAEAFEQPRCPVCGSLEITFQGQSRKAALASLHVFSFPSSSGTRDVALRGLQDSLGRHSDVSGAQA